MQVLKIEIIVKCRSGNAGEKKSKLFKLGCGSGRRPGRLNMMSWQFAVRLNDRVDHFI